MSDGRAPALELEGLEVRYGAVPAVRGLTLHVQPGELVALVGPNGAGKSTTLQAIVGNARASAGDIRVNGRSVRGVAPERIARSGVSLVPEGRHIYAAMTVEENLRLGLVSRRARNGLDRDLAWLRELFPVVAEFAQREAGVLSGGQQQQLAIARALISGPDLLLLDEPSLGLAPTVVETVFGALGEIRERGVTVVLVEQRAQLAASLADRTYVMSGGELRLTLSRDEAGDTDRLVKAYFS